MHWFWRSHNAAAVDLPNDLVPQADAQRRNARPKGGDDLAREPCLIRSAWSWRYDDAGRLHCLNFIQRHLVVTPNRYHSSQFGQVLIEVVGKTIVVVN